MSCALRGRNFWGSFVTQFPIKTIIHPTDFSDASMKVFAHATAFSLAAQSRLYILHVAKDGESRDLYSQPHVRELLALRGKMHPQEPPEAIAARTGVQVLKVAMHPGSPRQRIDKFIASHECDLMVLATHHRTALMRLVSGSVAAGVSDDSHVPTLFLRDDMKGFIDMQTGTCQLETLLIPIGPEVSAEVVGHIEAIVNLVAPRIRIKRLHVGTQQPVVVYKGDPHGSMQIEVRNGAVVETIVHVAAEIGAGLIAMPTEGRHGLSDALLGTTTERVLREAPCPVLAVPMPGNLQFAHHHSGVAPKSKEAFPTDEHGEDHLPSAVAHVIENVEHTISDIALGFHLAQWHPISTAPCNQSLELRVAEGDDIVTVQFPCCRTNENEWINADLGTQVHLQPVQWRIWQHSKPPHPHRSQV
jgi:nucleotide-binding universal stress UspA family protein